MITQFNCPTCNKRTEVILESPFLSNMIKRVFKCGHSDLIKKLESNGNLNSLLSSIESIEGNKPFKYQIDGAEFGIVQAQGNVGLFDEMGLGKTVQALMMLQVESEAMLPCIIICKSIAKMNWHHHVFSWMMIPAQVIKTSLDKWFDKYQIHIMSYEMLRMLESNDEREDVQKILERVRTVIIDESHLIKSDTAKRTVAVKRLCKNAKYKIALSGTPFKNQGVELFSTLNILRPEQFSDKTRYMYKYFDVYRDGFGYKVNGLLHPERFKQDTSDFIIRRTMDEVLPDMPPVRRNNIFVELSEEVQKLYDEKLKEFTEFYDSEKGKMSGFEFAQNILAKMNMLRQITGRAKIDAGIDFVDDFLMNTERKIVLFVHHHRVADKIIEKVNESIKLIGGLDPICTLAAKDKDHATEIVDEFRDNPRRRVLVASTLSAGESINLQFCSDCLLVERQWNPANEEQAGSGRFRRIGQKSTINFNYLIATGTIDEFFTELVEKKRQHFAQMMDGKEYSWDETEIISAMAEMVAKAGRKRWKL